MVVFSVNASVMVAPRTPDICNHWWSWLVTVAVAIARPVIIVSHTSIGILLLQRAWKRSSMDTVKIFFISVHMVVFVEVKSCFGFLFAAGALIRNSGIFVGRFGEEMPLLSRIFHIDHKLYKPTPNLF